MRTAAAHMRRTLARRAETDARNLIPAAAGGAAIKQAVGSPLTGAQCWHRK